MVQRAADRCVRTREGRPRETALFALSRVLGARAVREEAVVLPLLLSGRCAARPARVGSPAAAAKPRVSTPAPYAGQCGLPATQPVWMEFGQTVSRAGVRQAGRRRRHVDRRLAGAHALARHRHRLLRPEPEEPRRHADEADRHGDDGGPRAAAVRLLVAADRLPDAGRRLQRARGPRPRDAVVGHERAVPRERALAHPAHRRARRASGAADPGRDLCGRRRARVVAAGVGRRRDRARDLRAGDGDVEAGRRARQPHAARPLSRRGHRSHVDRHPAEQGRAHGQLRDDRRASAAATGSSRRARGSRWRSGRRSR